MQLIWLKNHQSDQNFDQICQDLAGKNFIQNSTHFWLILLSSIRIFCAKLLIGLSEVSAVPKGCKRRNEMYVPCDQMEGL